MNRISRRRFLKIAGFGAGAAAIAAGTSGRLGAMARQPATGETRVVPTYCDICFWKCGAIARVRDGRLWKIEGHPDDPLSQGRLCPRGTGGIGAHDDPDRLRHAGQAAHDASARRWTASTWDQALEEIAERLKKIAAEHGPEAMAVFSHGIGGTFLKHTMRAYGPRTSPRRPSPNAAVHATWVSR